MTGELPLPWVRMHASRIITHGENCWMNSRTVHQTFNLVPSLMAQMDDYVAGQLAIHSLKLRRNRRPT